MFQLLYRAHISRLPVNQYLFRIGAADFDMCSTCKRALESILHMLRDCRHSRSVWDILITRQQRRWFFLLNYNEWLHRNINPLVQPDISSTFLAGIWHIWKARCALCFENVPISPTTIVHQVKVFVQDMKDDLLHLQGFFHDPVNGRWF